jgi:hypothetical protein
MSKLIAGLVFVAAVVGFAAPAQADDSIYLTVMHQQYFAHSFTDAQLLQEGYRVCNAAAKYDDESLWTMVSSDLGVSPTAAGSLVGAAKVGLGC